MKIFQMEIYRKREGLRLFLHRLLRQELIWDVYTVFRELNGLDSILQSGGRCNREGKRDKGEVFVFEFENEAQNDKMNITQRLLAEYKDISQPECIEEYYEEVFFLNKRIFRKIRCI